MAFVMPEIAVQRLIQYGISHLRSNRVAFDEIFCYLIGDGLVSQNYGQTYVDAIWQWFETYNIPVVQAWSLNIKQVPCFSIHLSQESEDESKAAISDFYRFDENGNALGVSTFNIMIDIGIHAHKNADQVLWMYYMLSYILFRYKNIAQSMGITLQTFSSSDWSRDNTAQVENIYTRWVRFSTSISHTWSFDDSAGPYEFGDSFVNYSTVLNLDNDE